MKLDPDFKRAWVDALRSGEYPQWRKTIAGIPDGSAVVSLCCIGVGYAVRRGLTARDVWTAHRTFDSSYLCTSAAAMYVGLDDYTKGELIHLNDNEAKSFTEIADYIEEHL